MIERKVGGDIDAYVAEMLEYPPKELAQYFCAEQVDAIACALVNVLEGNPPIIGDMTGFGKGRVAAALLRFQILRYRRGVADKPPIFITGKKNLYSDLVGRDLADIGMPDLEWFATDTDLKISDGPIRMFSPDPEEHTRRMDAIAAGRERIDLILTTYSQLQLVNGEQVRRHGFLSEMARGGFLVLDEAHLMGSAKLGERSNRGIFASSLTNLADNRYVCLSATVAKTPAHLSYHLSGDLLDFFSRSSEEDEAKSPARDRLTEALERGGLPFQQLFCAEMARNGQYLRRESSYAGIDFELTTVPIDRDLAAHLAQIKADILRFNERIRRYADEKYGDSHLGDNATGGKGAELKSRFASVAHNLIEQELLSYKAIPAARMAVERVRAGEKVVLAMFNTNGSHLDRFLEQNPSLSDGDVVPVTFAEILRNYLERSRDISVGEAYGDKELVRVSDGKLKDLKLWELYEKILEDIYAADYLNLPFSPIDAIKNELQSAGIRVAEMTGRKRYLDAEGRLRTRKGTPSANLVAACEGFNNGAGDDEIDVIIMTGDPLGFSLHSSRNFRNQQPRRMYILQGNKDVAKAVQTLGRINREGQVKLPYYTFLVADHPGEKRPTEIMARKMAGLNANVVGDAAGTVNLNLGARPDLLGPVGDWAVTRILWSARDRGFPDLEERLAYPTENLSGTHVSDKDATRADGTNYYFEGVAYRTTGRIHLLPLEEQERLWAEIDGEFESLLESLEMAGSDLVRRDVEDLDAKPLRKFLLRSASEDISNATDNPFFRPVEVTEWDCKSRYQSYSGRYVVRRICDYLGVEETANPLEGGKIKSKELQREARRNADEEIAALRDRYEDPAKLEARARDRRDVVIEVLAQFPAGQVVALKSKTNPDAPTYYGAVMSATYEPWRYTKAQSPNHVAKWFLRVALLRSPRKETELSFHQLTADESLLELTPVDRVPGESRDIFDLLDEGHDNPRERLFISTDNSVAGAFLLGNDGKTAIAYGCADGIVRQGVIYPEEVVLRAQAAESVEIPTVDAFVKAIELAKPLKTPCGNLEVARGTRPDAVRVSCPSSKAAGGKFYLNRAFEQAVGSRFASVGSRMQLFLPKRAVGALWDAICDAGWKLTTTDKGLIEAIGRASKFNVVEVTP